ncbi:hypothetical protein J3459_007749 [Metarhizium acridum]|uniref:uncharacterized protein n=1 Tax=Metarhizium acridum TaxID=92637 RepID=UPI001C6BFA9C|nr:hypothetical protein J3458_019068 [Metarhizium acridum]KAG8426862.1 hypothetical protein J3459_007749 [Metarhizium acridum]
MRESWDTGRFWIVCAARKSFASDFIFWNRQDSQFFGPASNVEDAWQQRLELLSEELQEMEAFVDINMAEMDSRPLAWEPDEDVYTKKVVPGIYFSG